MRFIADFDGPRTIVRTLADAGSEFDLGFYGTGQSVCSPKDMYDERIGVGIACARAMADFAYQLEQTLEEQVITKKRWRDLQNQMIEEALDAGKAVNFKVVAPDGSIFAEGSMQAAPPEEAPDEKIVKADAPVTETVEGNDGEVDVTAFDDFQFHELPPAQPLRTTIYDWLENYHRVHGRLLADGVKPKAAAVEAAAAANAIALG